MALSGGAHFPLPDWIEAPKLGLPLNDVPTFKGSYKYDGINADKIADKSIIIVLWEGVEYPNSRFVVRAGKDNDEVDAVDRDIIAFGYLNLFQRVILEAEPAKPKDPVKFAASTPGGLIKYLIDKAQARGAALNITYDFTATHDSNGVVWDPNQLISNEYPIGNVTLKMIREMVDQGYIDVRFNGSVLQVFNVDTMGTDVSDTVELRAGRDYSEVPRQWSSEEQAKFSMAIGDEGTIVRYTDPLTLDGPFGREEMAISQGGTKDLGMLALVNRNALRRVSSVREQLTRKVNILEDSPIPNVDYSTGDYIADRVAVTVGTVRTMKTLVYRVRSMEIDTGLPLSASLVLNDQFLEQDIKNARQIAGLLGGGSSEGGGGGTPTPTPEVDTTVPEAPTGVVHDRTTYEDQQGHTLGIASVDWLPPSTNEDGSALTDLQGFEVEIQTDGQIMYDDPTDFAPATIDQNARARFDRRGKATAGWVGGDNASNIRAADGLDWFFWADTIHGKADAAGKVANTWRMPHSSITISDPTIGNDLVGYFASPNALTTALARCESTAGWTLTNATIATNAWKRNGFGSLELTRTAVGAMSAYAEVPAVPGATWRAEAQFDPAGTATETIRVQFLNAANGSLGIWDSTVDASGRGSVLSGVAPANTAKVRILVADLLPGAIGDKLRWTQAGLSNTTHQLATWRLPMTTIAVKNLFVNPAFATTSGTVEVRRNLCPNPVPTSTTGWTGIGGTLEDAPWDPTRKAYRAVSNGTNGHYLFSAQTATNVVSGTTVTVSAMVQVPAGKWYRYAVHNRTPNQYRQYSPYVLSDGLPVRVKLTHTLTSDAATLDFALLAYDTNAGGLLSAGQNIYAGDVTVAVGLHSDPFHGASPAAAGLTYSWAGTAHLSESIATGASIVAGMQGQSGLPAWQVPGVSPSGRAAISAYPAGSPSTIVLIGANSTAAVASKYYAMQVKVRVVGGLNTETVLIGGNGYNGGTSTGAVTESKTVALTAAWQTVNLRSSALAGAGTTNVRPLFTRDATWAASPGRIEVAEVAVNEVVAADQLPVPFFDGSYGTGIVWDGTINNSPSTWTINNTDHNATSPTSMFVSDDAGGPLEEYIWASDAFAVGNRAFVFASGQRYVPGGVPGGFGFTSSGNLYLAEIDTATKKLVRFERWSNDEITWGNATRVDGGYVYIMGYKDVGLFSFNNYLSRVPVANPWGTREYWNGAAWVAGANNATNVVNTTFGISAFRKFDGEWIGLYTPFYDDQLFMAKATNLTGPWTTGHEVFKYPEASGQTGNLTFKYLARFVPQWDDASKGIAMLYCQNGDAIGNSLNYVPQILRGPKGVVAAGSPGTNWYNRQIVDSPPTIYSSLVPGSVFNARVRAFDNANPPNYSDWAAGTPALVPEDEAGPPKPSTPLATGLFRGARVIHDGLTFNGSPMPPDTWGWFVHVSDTGPDFEPTFWTQRDWVNIVGGSTSFQGLEWDKDYWVKIVYVDNRLNKSEPSDAVQIGTVQLADPDLPNKLITGAKVAENTIYAKNLTVAAFDNNIIAGGNMEEISDETNRAYGWLLGYWEGTGTAALIASTTDAAEVISGTRAMKCRTTTAGSQAVRTFATPASGGSLYFYSFKVRTTASLASGAIETRLWSSEVEADIIDFTKPHTSQQFGANFATTAGTVTTFEGSFTVPAGHKFISLSIRPNINVAAGEYYTVLDDVEFRKIIGEAALANASIGSAKIKFAAINDLHVADVSAGKLTAGLMTADITVSGRFKTGTVGKRWELDATYLTAYDASGNIIFRVGDGSAFMSGILDSGEVRGGKADFPHPFAAAPGRTHMDGNAFYKSSEATTNLCIRPSVELGLTGITTSAGTTIEHTGAAISDYKANIDIKAKYGKKAVKVYNTTSNGYVDIVLANVEPNTQYTVSWYSATTRINNTPPGIVNAQGDWANCKVLRTSDGTVYASGRDGYAVTGNGEYAQLWPGAVTSGISFIAYSDWQIRFWKTFTTPSSHSAGASITLRLPAPRTAGGGNETVLAVCYDGFQCEQKPYMTRYVDGDQPGGFWSGTPHGSTSSRGTLKDLHLPSYDDPSFSGNVNAPLVDATRIKVGTGAPHGSNYIERFNTNAVSIPQAQWWPVGFPDAGGMAAERTAQDDGSILLGNVFVAQATGLYMFTTSICWASNATGVRLLRHHVQTVANSGTKFVVAQDPREAANMGPNHVHTLTTTTFMYEGWSIGLDGWQNAGVNLDINANANAAPNRVTFCQIA